MRFSAEWSDMPTAESDPVSPEDLENEDLEEEEDWDDDEDEEDWDWGEDEDDWD